MPTYAFEHGGKTYSVEAPSPEAAGPMIEEVHQHLSAQAPEQPQSQQVSPYTGQPLIVPEGGNADPQGTFKGADEKLSKLVDMATPLGSARYIAKGLAGTGPMSPLGSGLAAADLVSLGLAGKVRTGAAGAALGWKGVGQSLASGAASGTANFAAGEAGAPAYVRLPLALAAGVAAGRAAAPEASTVRNVPKGEEAQALARVMKGPLGLPVEVPPSSRPGDVKTMLDQARQKLGAAVGDAKAAAMGTEASTERAVGSVHLAGYEALKKALNGLPPELSQNPAAANEVKGALDAIGSIDPAMPAPKALEAVNNIVEGLQRRLADSQKARLPVNLSGPIVGSATKAMQKSIDDLAPEEALAVAKAADRAYSKFKTLEGITYPASKTMAQEGPRLNPRKFLFGWETLDPAKKARAFDPEEIKAMDFLVQQKDPNILVRVAQAAAAGATKSLNKLGMQSLSFHPAIQFKEAGSPGLVKEIRQQLPALGRELTQREASETEKQDQLNKSRLLQKALRGR